MPIRQKINDIVHRKSAAPQAPPLPAAPLTQTTSSSNQYLSNDLLLNQRQTLNQTSFEERRQPLYMDDVQTSTYEQSALAEESFAGAGNRGSLLLRQEPTIVERVEKEVVIQERFHPIEKEEIQPVIYREREQLDVKQITQMMHETQIQPTLVEQRELAPEYREAVVERSAPLPSNIVLPTREVDPTLLSREVRAPIIEETIKKTVIEEVQPVIERDVIAPTLIQQTQTIYEKIIEAPNVTREIRDMRELGTRGMGNETVYNANMIHRNPLDRNMDGRVDFNDLSSRPLSSSTYESSGYSGQGMPNPMYGQQREMVTLQQREATIQQEQFLPTGQMLPAVASTRPAYAYLPAGRVERRPDFVGTGSEYVMAAKNIPLSHNRGLHTQSTFAQPQNYLRQ